MGGEEARFTEYGWDKRALFYPTDRVQGLLVGVFSLLFILHFSEILGMAYTDYLLLGFFPAHFAYHLLHGFLIIVFLYLVALNWPDMEGD